eukprot:524610_1
MYDTNYNYFTMYKVAIGLCDTNQKHLTLNFIQFHQDKCYNERNIKLFQMLISQKHFEISHNFKLKFLRNEANNKNGIWGNFDTLMWDVYGNKEHDNEWFKLFYVAFNTYQIEKAEIGDFIAGEMYECLMTMNAYQFEVMVKRPYFPSYISEEFKKEFMMRYARNPIDKCWEDFTHLMKFSFNDTNIDWRMIWYIGIVNYGPVEFVVWNKELHDTRIQCLFIEILRPYSDIRQIELDYFESMMSQHYFTLPKRHQTLFLMAIAECGVGNWDDFTYLMDLYLHNIGYLNIDWFNIYISAFKTYNKTELIPHFVGLYSSVLLNVNDITSLCLAQKYLIAGMLIQNITLQQDVEEYFPMITNLTNYIAKNSVTNRSALGMQATLEIMWLIAQKEIYNSSKHICTFYPTAYIIFNNDAARKSCAAFDLSRLEATDRLYIVWFIFKMCRSRKHYSLFLCKLRIAEIIRVDIQRIFQITSLSLLPYGNVYGLLYDNRNFSWIKRKIIKQKAMHEWTLSTFAYLIDFMLT